MLYFASSFSNSRGNILNKQKIVRSIPASTALAQASHQSNNVHTTNRRLRNSGEENGAQRRTNISFGKTMMKASELLRLAKKHILGQSNIKQCKNKAHTLSGHQFALV